MKKITLFIVSYVTWFLLVWPFDPLTGALDGQSLVVGVVVSLVTALLFGEMFTERPHLFYHPRRYLWALYYVPMFLWEMIRANIDVMYRVMHPAMPIHPGIVKVRTRLKSKSGRTALCNSITLTPGTMSVDITDDGYIYIHWINVQSQDVEEATRLIVEKFERVLERILE
ncbi:MAG: Na+/H+ antiporter subunit E [Verrucomicrobiota bacterium]